MKKCIFSLLLLILIINISCTRKQNVFSVLQFNIWQEGTMVDGGFDGIVDNIVSLNPDFITFSEVRNYDGVDFISKLLDALQKRGVKYYGLSSESTGIISKYEILEQKYVYPYVKDQGSILKAKFKIKDKTLALYSAHLDWRYEGLYLPKGYDGATWEKLENPILDVDSILAFDKKSYRLEAINIAIADAQKEIEDNSIVIIGGDFNEPSHLDWDEDTKNIREHNGLSVKWHCSTTLSENGYKDAFREIYADAVSCPGFTFPANTLGAPIEKLAWAPDTDDRERLDFIYYHPNSDLTLEHSFVVGPSGSICYGERMDNDSQDVLVEPVGVWPTDHKAVIAIFTLK